MNIAVIGNGFVGKATRLLSCENVTIISYDINPNLCSPIGTTLKDVCNCDIIFPIINPSL